MTQVTLAEEGLDTLFGTQDENLRRIERTFGVALTARGNELHINGDPEPVQVVERLLAGLSAVTERGYRFKPGDVQAAIRIVRRGAGDLASRVLHARGVHGLGEAAGGSP